MNPYTLGLYEKAMPPGLTWREKLNAAKEAGFDFIEISIDETEEKLSRLDMTKQERLELIYEMLNVGIPIRTMCLSGHRKYPLGSSNKQTRDRSLEIMEKAIILADDLGIRIIQLAGYDVYYEQSTPETRTRFEANLRKATTMAAGVGILLAFETMETEFMNTVRKAMQHVNTIRSVYLNVYPDAGNITNAAILAGTDVLEDVKAGEGHIAAMHLKETTPGVFREVPFGTGHVQFELMIEAAWAVGVRKYVTEFWYDGGTEWKGELAKAHEMMKVILDRQGE